MRIALLGAPGAGVEIQAKLLAERARVPRISAAGLVRDAARAARKKPPAVPAPSASGADERTIKLLEERLRARDCKRGFLLADYPRNIPEAQALDTLLGMLARPLQIAITFGVDDKMLVKNLTEQLHCARCGALFDRRLRRKLPPQTRGKCDDCGGKLIATSDHNAKTAAAQLADYHLAADPLGAYYKAQHKLRTVAAGAGADEVHEAVCKIVDLEIHPLEAESPEAVAEEADEQTGPVIVGGQINRSDPTWDILASRKPRDDAAKKSVAKKTAPKTAPKKPAAKKVAKKKPAPRPAVKKVATKVVKKAVKKTAAKKVTAKKSVAKKTAKKAAKKTAKKTSKKTGHG